MPPPGDRGATAASVPDVARGGVRAVLARRRFALQWLAVLLAATALAAGLARTDAGRAAEEAYVDTWHVWSGVRRPPQHTVFVTVDDATLLALKDEPLAFWAPYFGKAIDTLAAAGATAVGLDFLYQVSAEGWLRKLDLPDSVPSRSYDLPLRAALATGKAVLITHLVARPDGELELLTPPQDQLALLPDPLAALGIANLYPDADKHVRHFYPVLLPDPGVAGLGFAMQLALRQAGQDAGRPGWELAGQPLARERRLRRIGYAGPPGSIPTVSMKDLLAADALANPAVQAVRGRVAVIGASHTGSADQHFTPYSRSGAFDQMPGGEIHCNIVETLLSGRFPRPLPPAAELAYLTVVLALAALALLRLAPLPAAGLAAAIAVAALAPGLLAFRFDALLPVAGLQAGIAGAFLLSLGLRLTGEARARARLRELFGRYVSDEVVDVLVREDRRPDLGGEALQVTVLFSDIRGFTTLSEQLTAHEVVEMLNAYFTRVCAPILAEGGTVDKFIGDAVMAVFGSPVRHPDHARRALRAALGMAHAAADFRGWMQSRFQGRELPDFGIGIGLHTGEAVIGDIGTPKRREFTAIGDTVNAASRLEGATKELGCVIVASEATVQAAGAGVQIGRREEIRVKGRAGALRVCEVTGLDGG